MVAVDVHTDAIEGFFGIPLGHLSAVPMLLESVRPYVGENCVALAPDMGVAELAERYAEPLGLPVAVIYKARISGSEVSVGSITGEVRDRRPIIVDDMISTGGTQRAAIYTLLEEGCEPEITVVASHGSFAGSAEEDLRDAPVERYIVTDSVPPPEGLGLPLEVTNLAPLLASAIDRLHNNRSLDELLEHA